MAAANRFVFEAMRYNFMYGWPTLFRKLWRDLEEGDRIFSPMPFFWVGGLVFTLFSAMHKAGMIHADIVVIPR